MNVPQHQRSTGTHWQQFRRLMLLMTVVAFGTAGFAVWQWTLLLADQA